MTVNYVYLGYGTTDENGECKLDHDANGDSISHSYTGTGAGKIDVVASLDSPSSISDSSLVSETFVLMDCIHYDDTTTDNTSKYTWSNANVTHEITSDGCLVTNTGSSGNRYIVPKANGSNINMESGDNFAIEIDVKNVSVSSLIRLGVAGTNYDFISKVNTSNFTHFLLQKQGSTISIFVNGVEQTPLSYTGSGGDISLGLSSGSLIFKEFKIYPI